MAQTNALVGYTTGNIVEADSNNNLKVNLPTTASQAGYVQIRGREDEILRVTNTGYIMATMENQEFVDTVEGAAVNTNLWNQSVSGMTITQSGGFINLNPTNVTTANAYAILSSIQQFSNEAQTPIYYRWSNQASLYNLPVNTVMEFGWGTVATNAAPTDGVFIRIAAGAAYLVINNSGSELVTAFTLPGPNSTDEFFMHIYGSKVKFFQNNVRMLDVSEPTSQAAITGSNRQSIFFRVYNTATPPASSPTLKIGQTAVAILNAAFNKPYSDILIGYGKGGWQSPVSTFAQTTNNANSAAPASATLSNTAAGYATLGGQFQFAAVAGAETDYALFAYLVPAGYQLYVSSINIQTINTVVAVATTATVLQWSVGINSSAVSLATADGAGTWAPRRVNLGIQAFPVASAVGAVATSVSTLSDSNYVVDGGRYLHIILKMPVATATATEIFRGVVSINGFFE